MKIFVNEKEQTVAHKITLGQIASLFKVDSDLLIVNGFPASADYYPIDGDSIYLIKKGEIPSEDELEHLMAARHTPGVHAKLKKATVGVAGAGGLGSSVAVALARVGVGKLVVADFDVVEPSNLNRQQYFIDQIGMAKVEALAINIARINPYTSICHHEVMLTPNNIPQIFNGCSILVEAFDNPDMKAMLVETALSQMPDTKIIAASGMAGYGSNNSITTRKVGGRLYVSGDGKSAAKPGNGLMAPRVGIVAHHQANIVLRLLLGENEP